MVTIQVHSCRRTLDISQHQYAVLLEMFQSKAYLVTNEGKDYKAWLQCGDTKSPTRISTTTAKVLFAGGWIVQSKAGQAQARKGLFYYELSSKIVKIFSAM